MEAIALDDLVTVLDHCCREHARLAVVEQVVHARLRREMLQGNEPLVSATEAAKRLGVSPDWVRDHGEHEGIAVFLDGVTRYDPVAIDRLRRERRTRRRA